VVLKEEEEEEEEEGLVWKEQGDGLDDEEEDGKDAVLLDYVSWCVGREGFVVDVQGRTMWE